MSWILGPGFWTVITAACVGWVLWTAGIIWWSWERGRVRGHEAGYDEGFADGLSHARQLRPAVEAEPVTVWQRAIPLENVTWLAPPVLETTEPGPVRWAFEPWTGAGLGPATFEEEIAAMISNADAAYQRLLERQP